MTNWRGRGDRDFPKSFVYHVQHSLLVAVSTSIQLLLRWRENKLRRWLWEPDTDEGQEQTRFSEQQTCVYDEERRWVNCWSPSQAVGVTCCGTQRMQVPPSTDFRSIDERGCLSLNDIAGISTMCREQWSTRSRMSNRSKHCISFSRRQ